MGRLEDAGTQGPTRRALLAAPLLPAVPARAQGLDDSLTEVMRRGVLRVNIAFWTAGLVSVPGEAEPRMRDAFHEGMARLFAQELGVRAEILPALRSGDGMRRLIAGEVDLALAPPITRGLLREIMFCTPHLALDLVVVAKAPPGRERGRPDLREARLGALTVLAPALADRRTLEGVVPVENTWLLARRLLDQELDGIIVSSVTADALLRYFPEAGLRVQRALTTSLFAGAVAYGAHDLRRVFNLLTDRWRMEGRLAALFRQETGLPFNPLEPV
jgi:membrane-bound lytic murein transglycosylase MltF